MRRDVLAAGAQKASFAGGIGENDIFRNVAPETTEETPTEVVATPSAPKLRFIPVGTSLLVRRIEVATSSVLITDTMEKEKPAEGTVLASKMPEFPQGTHIVFGKYSGTEFKLNGEVLLLLPGEDVTGILVPESEPYVEYEFPAAGSYIAKA